MNVPLGTEAVSFLLIWLFKIASFATLISRYNKSIKYVNSMPRQKDNVLEYSKEHFFFRNPSFFNLWFRIRKELLPNIIYVIYIYPNKEEKIQIIIKG